LVVKKVSERLAASKRAAQKIDTERFDVKKLNEGILKNSIRLQSETSLQLWKTVRTTMGHGPILERRAKFRPKGV
jgi:hypothetical protein